MPRARNIKPGFFTNDLISDLEPYYQLLFIGLWVLADREGRLLNRPNKIKRELFPGKPIDVELGLIELEKAGFVKSYEKENLKIIQILNWKKHQHPHVKESASTIPAPDEHHASTRLARLIPDSLIPDSLIPDSKDIRNARANGNTKINDAKSQKSDEDFEKAWELYPDRPGRSKEAAFKQWQARLKEGHEAVEMIRGVSRYRTYCDLTKTEPQYIKLPATFFGPGKHFLADWKVQNKAKDWANRLTGNDDDGLTIDI